MKQKTYRQHTLRTRQLTRITERLREKMRYHRQKYLDCDVILGAIRYKIDRILEASKQ
jgi:hypothetical protein